MRWKMSAVPTGTWCSGSTARLPVQLPRIISISLAVTCICDINRPLPKKQGGGDKGVSDLQTTVTSHWRPRLRAEHVMLLTGWLTGRCAKQSRPVSNLQAGLGRWLLRCLKSRRSWALDTVQIPTLLPCFFEWRAVKAMAATTADLQRDCRCLSLWSLLWHQKSWADTSGH